MGVLLFYCYIIAMSQFRSLRSEFDSAFYFFEQVIFATLPLFASVILSWFICVEIPDVVDMSICFSTIYYLYSLVLLHPRLSSHPNIAINAVQAASDQGSNSKPALPYVLHTNVVKAVYMVPVVLCPVVYISMHYNILTYGNFAQFISLFMSLILPVLYMTLLIEQQLQYFPSLYSANKEKLNKTLLSTLGTLKLVIAMLLFICVQDHPLFDDIKSFSGFDEDVASAAICFMMLLLMFAVFVYRTASSSDAKYGNSAFDFYSPAQVSFMEDMKKDHGIANVFVTICLCLAALTGGTLLRASWFGLTCCCAWAVSAAELYQLKNPAESPRRLRSFYALAAIMGLSASSVSFSFTYETLYFLRFTFRGDVTSLPISIQSFCKLFAAAMFLASIVPPIAIVFRSGALQRASLLLPSSGASDGNSSAHLKTFSFLFQFCVFVFMAMELLIREQNWSDSNTTVEDVYPSYLMAGSSILLLLTTVHLHQIQLVDIAAVTAVLLTQGCKLLHLAGLPSQGVASLCSLLLNYTLPFAFHLGDGRSADDVDTGEYSASASLRARSNKARMSAGYFLAYLVSAAFSTGWAFTQVSSAAMRVLMAQEPSTGQRAALCLAWYCSFASLMFAVFYKQAPTLRSVFILMALLSLLLAVNALGAFNMSADPNSPVKMVLSLQPEMTNESTGVYLILSLLLLLSAASGVFPVRKPVPRLLFLLAFSYCSARASMGWFFPLHMGTGLQAHLHSLLQLPWLYSLGTVMLAASSSIHASAPSNALNSTSGWLHLGCAALPLLALLYSVITDTLHEYYEGIFWTAACSNSCVCVLTRLSEITRTLSSAGKGASAAAAISTAERSAATSSATATLCATSAVLGVVWTAVAAVSSRGVYADLAVPAASLLFIFTRAGVIVADKPPLAVAAICASGWWLLSALHSILVRGHSAADGYYLFFATSSDFSFGDSDVSVWTNHSLWVPLLNLLMMLVPLPAILLSFARRSGESEDVLFILAVLSCVPVIGAGVNSVRLLGSAGTIFASCACYQLSASLRKSQRML